MTWVIYNPRLQNQLMNFKDYPSYLMIITYLSILGYNINIPWNGSGMGDPEYAMAFFNIVLPVAYQFNPDLVLVSSGFDAARGDPLGRCKISPEFYGHMTNHLKVL